MDGGSNPRRAGDTINLHDAYQVHQWTEIFNISAVALHSAVMAVGTNRSDVKRYLRALKSSASAFDRS